MVDETEAGKGRPTPSRKEAEAARKKQMKVPVTRKEQAKRERAAREELRLKQRDALKTGDEKYLPARDRGPERRLVRDFVDRRRNLAEYAVPILFAVLIAGFISSAAGSDVLATYSTLFYTIFIAGIVIDDFILVRSLKRELKKRFDPQAIRGLTTYAILRTFQIRRMRLPKPQVKHGEPLADRYR